MVLRTTFFLIVSILCTVAALGQNTITVTGSVLDSKTREPLPGVNVKEKETIRGTVTDNNGVFIFEVPANAVLVFTYVGFFDKEVSVNNNRNMEVLLEEKVELLDEVVVIGYGVQKKSDVTGSISFVSGKDINDVPVSSALQALQGKSSGVNIIQNTGAPGSPVTIKIRGTGTINDSDPLYVVNGFIVDDITHINPNDIASIEIFKDAASSAIYGARGANGIVVITTKSAEKGDVRITFDSYVGLSKPWKTIPVMNTEQYALMLDYRDGLSQYSAEGRLYYSIDPSTQELVFDDYKFFRVDTIRRNSPANWWDAITQTGVRQQYNLSIAGGSDKSKYIVSANYYDEKGIVNTSHYNRFNTRMNLENHLAKWLQMSANIMYSFEDRDVVPEGRNSILKLALYQPPMVYIYNTRGYWSGSHPLAILDRNHENSKRHRIDMNISLNAQIFPFLNYQFKISDYLVPAIRTDFAEVNKLNEDFLMTDLTSVYKRQEMTNKWEINNLLTFTKENSVHHITLLAGQILEGNKWSYHWSTKRGAASNDPHLWFLSSAYTGDKTEGLDREWTAVGFVGRINYNLLDKYLLQVNFRADASSIFDKEERWGYFPSISVGWKFSSEPFMQNYEWLSFGKLRAGWGQLGNNRIDEMSRFTLLNTLYHYPYGVGNHIIYPGTAATGIGNPGIRWEKTETTNIGIDLGFFNNRINVSAEVFDKLTTDMLLRVPVPVSVGLDYAPMTNAGSVRNRGIELSVNHRNRINLFSYEVGFNVSYIKNEVVSLGTGNEPIYGAWLEEESMLDFATKTDVGRPIGSFYGYVTNGLFNSYEEIRESPQYEWGKNDFEQTTRPGDFRFVDINGDGRITAEDRTYLGSPLPDYVFGIPLSFGYSNFSLNIFFQGQAGNKIFNVMEYYLNNAAIGNMYADIREKHWSGQLRDDRTYYPINMDNASVPDLYPSDRGRNFRASDFFIQDGSYIRLKEMRLSYSFDKRICDRLQLSDLVIYLGAYNLLTFTKYNGLDPEIGRSVDSGQIDNINMGVDHGNYPQARTITIGFRIAL